MSTGFEFERWLILKEHKSGIVAHRYNLAINSISRHYSEKIKKETDLYKIYDIEFIKYLKQEYGINGKYYEIGNKGKGNYRFALSAYVRFLKYNEIFNKENNNTNLIYGYNINNILSIPIKAFFPNYNEIEYKTSDKYKIISNNTDILLENIGDNSIILIKIIEGVADYHVFNQMVYFLGLLSDDYPDKLIKGVIIGNEIDESLVKACSITDKIEIMKYKINIKLEKYTQTK